MTTKNLIDGDVKRPSVLDDKTGEYLTTPRLELAEALELVHEAYIAMKDAKDPSVSTFMTPFALQAFCRHTGWQPHDIAGYIMIAATPTAFAG